MFFVFRSEGSGVPYDADRAFFHGYIPAAGVSLGFEVCFD